MVQQSRVLWLVVAGILVFSALTWGADIVVSTDGVGTFRSIQRAIDAASYGDTIVVNPGIYEETLVLISGITIRGAGPTHTVIRSSYGYQPVVKAVSAGAVTIENLALERSASILESVVVDIQSSHITFRNCRIAGGQEGGIRSVGVTTLLLDGCRIEDNAGYGLQVSGANQLDIRSCTLAGNGSIGLYLQNTSATITETIVEWNDWYGITLEGTATLNAANTTLANSGRWGISVSDSASACLTNCTLTTQAFGNVLIDDSASLELDGSHLQGGMQSSIEASGESNLLILNCQITDASDKGVLLLENATLRLDQTVVARCGGTGLLLETSGLCQLSHATVAYNGGDGLDFRGSRIEVSHSIVAVNAGIGLDVHAASGASQSLRFEYNNVWGNQSGDYAGIHRSASDMSDAPEFANPALGDWTLSLRSPCLDAGAFGAMLGAGADPRWQGGAHIELGVIRATTDWGSIEAIGHWNAIPSGTLDGTISWEYPWQSGRAAASATITGFTRVRAESSIEYSPRLNLDLLGGSVSPTLGISGVMDGPASRWLAGGVLHVERDDVALRIEASYEGPAQLMRQDVELSMGAFSFTAQAIDFSLTDIRVAVTEEFATLAASSSFGIELSILPHLQMTMRARWTLSDALIQIEGQTFLTQLGTSAVTVKWDDRASTQASLSLRLRSGEFEGADVRVSTRLADLTLMGSLGASAQQGPRCKLSVLVDTSLWFLPRANQSPSPAYTTLPLEPEAGEPITFDASTSYDPDGELDQIWWDFGDGTADIGRRVEHLFDSPGEYTITLTISDEMGAVTSLVDALSVREARTTPVAAFTWAPVSEGGTRLQRPLRAGDFILLDAVDSRDPNGDIAEYGWDIQSDGVFDYMSDDPRTIVDPLPAGTWPVTLRVVDSDGNSDALMRVLAIEELKMPEANFDLSPAMPAIGDPIRFTDSSIPGDGSIVSWEWDFGDGHTSREPQPLHRYQEAGSFDVQLTVRDAEGLFSTITRPVIIELNPALVPIEQVWALLIGISDYAEVDDLSYASRDAEAIGSWLLDAGVPADHIRLLTDGSISPDALPLDRDVATLINVRAGLGWLRQEAGRDDLVLIHFSGHGYQGADDNLDERDGVDEFFVLHDTRASAKDDTALRDDEFGRFLDRIESEHVLVFFDSCYSGGLSRSLTPGSRATGDAMDVFSDFRLEGRLVLSASSENQDAFESPQLEHGVLTHFLLQGLDGAADLNVDGHVTVWELFEHVRSEVPPFVQAERGEIQLPQLLGQGDTRVVLTRSPEVLDFSYCPAIPLVGAAVVFRSQSNAEPDTLHWDFGDGTTSTGEDVIHHFASPGTYSVQLQATGDVGTQRIKTLPVTVTSWATIVGFADDPSQVIVSAGRQHGLVLGDRLALLPSQQQEDTELQPALDVVELIGEDTAICQILRSSEEMTPGSRLVLLPDANKPSCFGSP